jgi:SMODS-associated and fused to various effectors sensor domain
LPTAFAFGYFFSESSHFTLLIEGSNGTWSTSGSISDLPSLRILKYNTKSDESDESESFVNAAIVEVAMSHNTASAVAQYLPLLGLSYKHHIRFEPLSGPSNVAVEDAAQALAMARQIGRELRRLCDSEGISHIHLFASLPATLAVMIGHQLNGLCPVTLYQFINTGARYVPVCTLDR